ncbi:hypothetical protein, partial [Klebsiella michiganensis]|uniref:hypothetical protein n=1 Tax=Klebsiella michiganensis TaxID=1134687 RepID=UPI001CCA1A82
KNKSNDLWGLNVRFPDAALFFQGRALKSFIYQPYDLYRVNLSDSNIFSLVNHSVSSSLSYEEGGV